MADEEEHSFQLFSNQTAGGTRSPVTSHGGRVNASFSFNATFSNLNRHVTHFSHVCDFRDSRRRCQHSHA